MDFTNSVPQKEQVNYLKSPNQRTASLSNSVTQRTEGTLLALSIVVKGTLRTNNKLCKCLKPTGCTQWNRNKIKMLTFPKLKKRKKKKNLDFGGCSHLILSSCRP